MTGKDVKLVDTGATPLCALAFLPRIVRVAKNHGYALTVHGSLARDYDFVAVPWIEECSEPQVLANAIREECGGFFSPEDIDRLPIEKLHGRVCFPIHLCAGPYIDLSVITPRNAQSVPDGWRMVPIVPTDKMLKAVFPFHYFCEPAVDFKSNWAKAIASAPTAPAGDGGSHE